MLEPSVEVTANVPVLVDTDIGSDIDDAVCLSYLLSQPGCELLGVTTVSGEPKVRAALAAAVCRAAERPDIPIHAGTEAALLSRTTPQPKVPQAAVLSSFEHTQPGEFAPNTAVQFLYETILSRPNEVTLLAIGPLTNVALLFATYPDAAAALRALVVMGGSFSNRSFSNRNAGCGPFEWNIWCDPYAGSAVYGTTVSEHRSVGIDVTRHCALEPELFVSRLGTLGGPWSVVAAITELWQRRTDPVVLHDALAAAAMLRPQLCRWATGRVTVELVSDRFRGVTSFDVGHEGSPHAVATNVDVDASLREIWTSPDWATGSKRSTA